MAIFTIGREHRLCVYSKAMKKKENTEVYSILTRNYTLIFVKSS